MADFNVDRGMKRKKKPGQLGLAPAATAPKFPSQQDGQSGGIGGHSISNTLEIGTEFQLDLHNEDLVVLKELGFGNGGTVSKVQHAATKVIMAKKVIHVAQDDKVRKQIIRELHIMHDCNSPYIISFYGAFMSDGRDVVMCMEYMDCGSLDRISKDFGPVRVDVLGKIAEAVLGGLTYLYDTHKIMHRDIKPSNVLVNSKGQIKLCDFGVSGELINSVAATFVGTSTYMAPERISGAASYTVRSDVWSVGLMLMELAIGEFPFRGDDAEDEEEGEGGANEPMTILALLQRIVNEPAPKLPDSDAFPHMLDEMIAKCLIKVPEQRPTPQELLDHDQFIQASKRTPVDIREWAIGLMERNNRRSHLLPQMTPASRDALRTGMMPAIAEQGASRNGPAPSGVSKVGSSNPQNHQPTPPPSSRESRTAQSSSSGSRGLPSGGSQRHVMPQPPSVSTHTVPASTAAYDYGATQSAIDPAISRPYPPRSTSSSNLRSTPLTTHPSEFRSTPFTTHKDEAPAAQSSKPMPDYATDYRQHPAFQSGGADNDRGQRERSTARSTSSANSDSLPLQYMDSASSPPNQKGDPLPTPPESGRSRPGVGPQNHRAMTEEEAMVRGAARLNLNGDQSDWQHY